MAYLPPVPPPAAGSPEHLISRVRDYVAGFAGLLALIGDTPETDRARERLFEAGAWAEAAARGDSILRT